jgi:minor extracellular serine protease Vpr
MGSQPCDIGANAIENAIRNGMTVVVAAGNEGDTGVNTPTLGTIGSPGTAPSAITVGATTNSHVFVSSLRVPGPDAPPNLQQVNAVFGDGPTPSGPLTAPLRDVTALGDNGFACAPLPMASLNNAFALIERGPGGSATACSFATKVINAQIAGAIGVVLYAEPQQSVAAPGGLVNTGIPAALISNSDGLALKAFIDSNPDHPVTLDPSPSELSTTSFNRLAGFSSRGPSTGDNAIKPELVATGTNMYMAAEQFDPLGDVYSANGYAVADGTSFSTPLVSGAAALVKEAHRSFTPAQIKSALVNTASQDVTSDESGNQVSVREIGGGKLDAGMSLSATVTSEPATLSFGALDNSTLPLTSRLTLSNAGTSAVNLGFAFASITPDPNARLSINPQSLSLAPGGSGTVSVMLAGNMPAPGAYEGTLTAQGSGASVSIPYLYLAGSGVAANVIPLTGAGFDGTVGETIPDGFISFRLIDRFGVAVSGSPVTFSVLRGANLQTGATFRSMDTRTDSNGIASAEPVLGPQPGMYGFRATAGGQTLDFNGSARPKPTIGSGGIVNAASLEPGKPVAPGSYISIFGSGLSDDTHSAGYVPLPLAIHLVNVSFDVPSANLSVPGHLTYVSPGQVNVQAPWELQGQTEAQVKVTIDYSYGNVVTLPLATVSPAFFESSSGTVASLDQNNKRIGPGNAAVRGETIQLFANGLGPVTNQPKSGDPAPASPPGATTSVPVVMIGGQQAPVTFSGLAPGDPGLYQINIRVPSSLSPGIQPITLAIGGVTSKASSILVQ